MSSASLVKMASENFLSGNYKIALALYEKAVEIYGEHTFKFNVDLCKRNLSKVSQCERKSSCLGYYFDHVYVVNLKHQIGKRIKVSNQLSKAGVEFEIFEAINGYEGQALEHYRKYISVPTGNLSRYSSFNDLEIKRGKRFIDSPGAFGYIYTYLKILKDAKIKGYNKFLILEDDILLCENFEDNLHRFMSLVGKDWKILQLGASQYGWDTIDLEEATRNGYYYPRQIATCGSFAIAIDNSVVNDLVISQSSFEAPFDHLPLGEIYEKFLGNCFVCYPNIVMPDVGVSSIRGGRCQYSHGIMMKWDLSKYDYPCAKPSVAIIVTSSDNLKYLRGFSNFSDLHVELRLYYYSSDGLRPLHNNDCFPSECLPDNSSLINLRMPSVDFCLIAERDFVITEDSIYRYVEYILGVGTKVSGFSVVDFTVIEQVKGRVSVIVPTYKRPNNLKMALVSVLEQSYEDIELIVVSDNGSGSPFNKSTIEIVDELKIKYPNRELFCIEHSINRNGSAARNTGILACTGEFVCFLDDDDIYLPERISKSIETLRSSAKITGGVYCGYIGWNSPVNDSARYKAGDLTLEILTLDFKSHYLCTNTATYKREAVLALNGFDESYRRHQDLEFNLRFFEVYTIDVVNFSGVKLNPEPSDVSNKVHGIKMVDLKLKFLSQFDYIISKFPEHVSRIHEIHRKEILNFASGSDLISEIVSSHQKNLCLQLYASINKAPNQ